MSEKLALEGGTPAIPQSLMQWDWERYRPADEKEIEAVTAVLRSGHLSVALPMGMPQSDALGSEFAEWVGTRHCLVVNSGTAALHCAVAGIGVQAMAVLHQNAIPVFADIAPDTALIDPEHAEACVTPRTKAIMAVHLHGQSADMDAINAIAKRHDLKVIEDSAQTYGGLYKGKKTGALGDAGCFAMTTTKQLMVGEGGLMTTDDDQIYDRAAATRLFGEPGTSMTAANRAYMSEFIGWNYKLPETTAALARARLPSVASYVAGCQQNAAYLDARIGNIRGLQTPVVAPDRSHTYYHYSLQVDPAAAGLDVEDGLLRNAVMAALKAEGADMMTWQSVPVPAQPLFQNKQAYGNGSPWNTSDSEVSYDMEQYPNTFQVLERSFVLRRMVPPNPPELLDCYAAAFQKVFTHLDRVVQLYKATGEYVPLETRKARLAPTA